MSIPVSLTVSRVGLLALMFLFTLLSGVWVSHSGRPLPLLSANIHKMIALATAVVLGMTVSQLHKVADSRALVTTGSIVLAALSFLALIATGAMLTRERPWPAAVLTVHQLAPIAAAIASGLTLYLLASQRS